MTDCAPVCVPCGHSVHGTTTPASPCGCRLHGVCTASASSSKASHNEFSFRPVLPKTHTSSSDLPTACLVALGRYRTVCLEVSVAQDNTIQSDMTRGPCSLEGRKVTRSPAICFVVPELALLFNPSKHNEDEEHLYLLNFVLPAIAFADPLM